ncbi:HlyD family secretion protein [Psychromonas sp. 14N.309.X.WAT.B.A12]|jgi:multidrug resistance efflux pump|uniref:HlyD family secretion protein n=1 Tax=unclassified Psychromonas TaxID=2614957 RepID=UPI0025B1995A|nr:HlyD family secretion protein [Psychromonas sp. 14N.309.X.WAT.B.A12]MDN2662969.1 HlyD family secretion protein [Psychromonas sp. 14N.309.X.WAT.B.A12]
MTPEEKFTHYVRYSVIGFICVFIYYLIADVFLPVTPQARVYHSVVQISPQISGRIVNVAVNDNQTVKAGDLLFEIDPGPYQLALQQAQLTLADARLQNKRFDSNIKAIQAQIAASKATLHEKKLLKERGEKLFKQKTVSQQDLESLLANYEVSKANQAALEAQLSEAILARGDKGEDNLAIRHAVNQVSQAELNLSYTKVRALSDGVVTNLQLLDGSYATAGKPLLAVVSKKADLVADFREKSLMNMHKDSLARVVFDSRPGEVYQAKISSFEAGVSSGQLSANGLLSTTETSTRWVRDAQRQRLHFTVLGDTQFLSLMPSGARATVQLLPDNIIGQWFGALQIRLISWLHYIY